MISVLFVDDEPNLRADLQRMLRNRRDRWSMRFAGSGAEALDMIRSEPVDVVVSDMQMPGMDGAALVARIRRDYPDTILIILSGQYDRRTTLQAIDPAHIYLAKPCDCAALVNAIERAYRLRTLVSEMQPGRAGPDAAGRFCESSVYVELVQMLKDPDVAIESIATTIGRDQGLTTKILQLVNAAFFGASWRIRSPLQAIRLLGLDLVRSLVLDIARSVAAPDAPGVEDQANGSGFEIEQPSETGIAIAAADDTLHVRFANDAFRRLSTRAGGEVVGRPCRLLEGADADPQVLQVAREGRDVRATIRAGSGGGTPFWSDLSVTPLLDGSGRPTLFLCTQTELAPADAAKCDAVGREPAIAFDGLGEGILLLDRDGGIVAVNAAFESICNYSPAEVVGRTQDFLDSPLHGREFYAERERIVEETGYWRGEAWHRLRNGLSVPHFQTISRIDDGDARSRHYVITFRTALKKRDLERLRFLSNRDALTGLPNRTSFAEEVGAAVERAALAGGGCAVLAIHLDRFKLINDSLGGTAADRLLRTQAERLHDYIGERGLVGGGGRGEFLLLVEDLRSDKEAEIIVREVATALSRPIDIEGQEVAVNVSVGFSCFPGDGDEAVRLIANAQAALLEPDGGGSCSYRRFAREMNVHSVARFNIGNRLRSAIEREELILHYQPKVSLATGTITGLEALVRWHRPREGYVSPAVFIPIAEETRLIETIGEWVLETACRQMRVWQRMGIAPARMAVNLSPHQFRQVDLLDRIVAVLGATGLDPTAFEAEITESSTMSDPEAAIQLMDALYDMGITLAIDDFGTGYSSLTYLKRFPINSIKIDQSFVRGLPRDMNDIAIVEAVIALAKSLSFGLVAEGVETEEQRNFLFERGCEEMQGYLFSRPRSATEVEPLLRASALAARQAVSA